MLDQLVELFERAFVEEDLDSLPGGEPSFAVLAFASVDPASFFSTADFVPEDGDSIDHGVVGEMGTGMGISRLVDPGIRRDTQGAETFFSTLLVREAAALGGAARRPLAASTE